MQQSLDGIPVLTDLVEEDRALGRAEDDAGLLIAELEAHLATAIHEHADELVHNACREMEALLLEQVSDRIKADLPSLVAGIVEQHFRVARRGD